MPNRLAGEASPYLRQHAENPVDWHPWGPEALALAREKGRPILLSIGYAACHWCHVMEHESFSDPGTAAEMNAGFVNIKVDREERPDLDDIYMTAVQAFTGGHGGWPMTLFLTPEGEPFLGGTYFPPERRGRMPSFRDVMKSALELWSTRRGEVDEIRAEVRSILENQVSYAGGSALADDWLGPVTKAAEEACDRVNGGFGRAPKFPPHQLMAALLVRAEMGDRGALSMVTGTLRAMIRGGTYDHLAGGFARYSVDTEWRIPHFEKMLYDNAQLVPVLVDAWRLSGDPTWARIARETLGFMDRELSRSDGLFGSAFDADSEGVEGRFYAWTPGQLLAVLGADGPRAAALLQVTAEGTFEHGTSVLRLEKPLEAQTPDDQEFLRRVLPKLYEARSQRVWPSKDDKAVTAWNALAIRAFVIAAQAFDDDALYDRAARAMNALITSARTDGRWRRTAGSAIPGFLDDYAATLLAALDLWETRWDPAWLDLATSIADAMPDLFWDGDEGPFYAGSDGEKLVVRPRKPIGGAEPSGAAMAALAFARMDALLGRTDLGARADRILLSLQGLLSRAPRALGLEAVAATWRTHGAVEIGVVGTLSEARDLVRVIREKPRALAVTAVVSGEPAVPWMADRERLDGRATAYVCENYACRLPVTDPQALREQLDVPLESAVDTLRMRAPQLPADPAQWVGTPRTLQDLRGQIVVLDFWTFCCINCMHVLPELAEIERRFAGHPVAIVGVHSAKFVAERQRPNVERAIARYGIDHPVVLDPDHALWNAYAVRSWPTIVVLDPEGRVAWQKAGEVTAAELAGVIEELLPSASGTTLEHLAAPDDGSALRFPGKVSVHTDGAGTQWAYIADSGHHRVLEVRLDPGTDGWPIAFTTRSFGTGHAGFSDSEGTFRDPQGVSRRGEHVWVADTGNHAIRRIHLADGRVETMAGTGRLGRDGMITPGKPKHQDLRSPWDVFAAEDVVFVAMAGSHQIWVYLEEQGRFGPFIGSGNEDLRDGEPQEAHLAQPSGIAALGPYVFWADSETSAVRIVDLTERQVRTLVGQGLFDFGDVDGEPGHALMQHPLGLAVDQTGVYVADTYNGKIKRIDLDDGVTSTVADGFLEPGGVAILGDKLLVADTGNHRIMVVDRATGEQRRLL